MHCSRLMCVDGCNGLWLNTKKQEGCDGGGFEGLLPLQKVWVSMSIWALMCALEMLFQP